MSNKRNKKEATVLQLVARVLTGSVVVAILGGILLELKLSALGTVMVVLSVVMAIFALGCFLCLED